MGCAYPFFYKMYIVKNTSNKIVLTLSENQTTTSHDWLFEFTSLVTGEVKYCHAVDISAYTDRYNEFSIIDNATENAINGTLDFSPTGSWTYRVYEMTVASPPSLTPSGYLAIVEEGSLKVYSSTETTISTFDDDEDKDNAVFDQ